MISTVRWRLGDNYKKIVSSPLFNIGITFAIFIWMETQRTHFWGQINILVVVVVVLVCNTKHRPLLPSCASSTAHRGVPCENSDAEMGLSRRRPVGRLRLRGATDDGPPPLLPSTTRGLYG